MILESRLLASIPGVRHGFSTRLGGISTGAYATLNLDRNAEPENHVRLRAMIGVPRIVTGNQVHGTTVLDPSQDALDGDALVSSEKNVAVGVRTADCVPILAAATIDRRAVAVAAIHAGWRGAVAGVVAAALARFPRGAATFFALGPAIDVGAFEVGDEVIEAAKKSLDGAMPPMRRGPSGKPHLDLRGLVEAQLARLDVPPDRVERVGGCTFSAPALFFSHRRDKGVTGRQLSAIALAGGPG